MKEIQKNWSKLQENIGYKFQNEALLKQALSHSSYINEHGLERNDCNERLEFLGDAVLELVSSEYLYNEYKELPEGELTKLRASLVCEPALAFDAREIGINEYLLLGKGEDHTGGRERDSIISDACEAVIGAIFLDGGIDNARRFILSYVLNDAESKKLFYDSKSVLQEAAQRDFGSAPEYRIIDESGPAHLKNFTAQVLIDGKAVACGSGRTKKSAEQQASYNALLRLKNCR